MLVKDDESMVMPEKDTGVAKSAPTEILIAKSPAVSNVFPEKERLSAMSPIGIWCSTCGFVLMQFDTQFRNVLLCTERFDTGVDMKSESDGVSWNLFEWISPFFDR